MEKKVTSIRTYQNNMVVFTEGGGEYIDRYGWELYNEEEAKNFLISEGYDSESAEKIVLAMRIHQWLCD